MTGKTDPATGEKKTENPLTKEYWFNEEADRDIRPGLQPKGVTYDKTPQIQKTHDQNAQGNRLNGKNAAKEPYDVRASCTRGIKRRIQGNSGRKRATL